MTASRVCLDRILFLSSISPRAQLIGTIAIHKEFFSDVIGDTIENNKAQEFQQKLIESHEVEMLASEILGQEETSDRISELERISGSFLALSSAIKAGK